MPERTLVVWCPDWQVMAAGHLAGDAVAVLRANRVAACSPAARAEGVAIGLRRREAQGRCPGLVVLPDDEERDARAFEPVVAAVEQLVPRVEVGRPGSCAVVSRGAARYYGGEEALATKVAASVDAVLGRRGRCSTGIADGRFAAGLAARLGVIIAQGATRSFLAPQPVGILELPDLAGLLVRLGLPTLGDLATLPAADVAARFGPEGARAYRLASGLDELPFAARRPPPDLVVTALLDPPAEQVEPAAFAAKALADELSDRLGALGLACTRLLVEAESEHGERHARLWRHDRAAGSREAGAGVAFSAVAVAERVRWQLDGWLAGGAADRPTAGISLLRLTPDEIVPDRGRQPGFWGGQTEADERAARGIARVQALLGHQAVALAVPRGGRGPADRIELVPPLGADPADPAAAAGSVRPQLARHPAGRRRSLAAAQSGAAEARSAAEGRSSAEERSSAEGAPPWPGRLPAPAPALVHPPGVPAEVLDAAGGIVTVSDRNLVSAGPARLWIGSGPWATIVAWAGPWPVDERWWDADASCRRARFQVVTADGAAHLLAVTGGQWEVEGSYS